LEADSTVYRPYTKVTLKYETTTLSYKMLSVTAQLSSLSEQNISSVRSRITYGENCNCRGSSHCRQLEHTSSIQPCAQHNL